MLYEVITDLILSRSIVFAESRINGSVISSSSVKRCRTNEATEPCFGLPMPILSLRNWSVITSYSIHYTKLYDLNSLEVYDFNSVLFPYNYLMMQNPIYKADVEQLLAVCKERNVAVQTIKSLARGEP